MAVVSVGIPLAILLLNFSTVLIVVAAMWTVDGTALESLPLVLTDVVVVIVVVSGDSFR